MCEFLLLKNLFDLLIPEIKNDPKSSKNVKSSDITTGSEACFDRLRAAKAMFIFTPSVSQIPLMAGHQVRTGNRWPKADPVESPHRNNDHNVTRKV